MLHSAATVNCLSGALDRQLAFLAGRASEHRPDLPHRGPTDGDSIDGEKMVARLNSIIALRHGRFAVEVGDAEDGESPIVFGAQDEPDDVEVRKR